MEIEEKIFNELNKNINSVGDYNKLDKDILEKINRIIIAQSVSICDGDKEENEASRFIENKLINLFNPSN